MIPDALSRRLILALLPAGLAGPALALPPTAAAPAVLSADDQALVNRAADLLQSLSEARGRFVQTDARGAVSRGEVFLKRPGRARFAYEPPSGLLVVADGHFVSVANAQLKTFDRYPLMATPLSLFLARRIRLDRGVVVTRVARMADGFQITARDGGKTAEGRIDLIFAEAPLRLAGWTVWDAQGQATRIDLTDFAPAPGLPPSLFVLNDPRPPAVGRARM